MTRREQIMAASFWFIISIIVVFAKDIPNNSQNEELVSTCSAVKYKSILKR